MRFKRFFFVLCLITVLLIGSAAAAANSYSLEWWTIDGGGGSSAGAVYTLHGTLASDTPVEQGLFTVRLDFGAVFTCNPLWLEVSIRPGASSGEFSARSPRQPLTSTRYASYSGNSDQLDGQHAGAFAGLTHDHLGETWLGSDNSLVISGTFGSAYLAPLVLNNTFPGGRGLNVIQGGDAGVSIGSANFGVVVESASSDGIYLVSTGDDGMYVDSAGGYGVFVDSAVNDALWGDTASVLHEWGLYTPDKISSLNVTTQSFVLVARAAGPEPLQAGDLVAAAGIGEALPGSSAPLALVSLADAAHPGVVGVVQGRMTYSAQDEPGDGEENPAELHSADGPVQPGDYVAIIINGVARARVMDPGGEMQPGTRLAVADLPGAARPLRSTTVDGLLVSEGAPVLGVALSAADAEGYAWVLVNPQ